MIHFQFSLLLGNYFSEIKNDLKQFEDIYLGLFISDLNHKSDIDGAKRKKEYYKKVRIVIVDINKKINHFNSIIKKFRIPLEPLRNINLIVIKRIIETHKGDYPQSTSSTSFTDEIFGRGDAPSVLARKHTALLIHNVLIDTKLSLSDFGKSVIRFVSPFNSINKSNVRTSIKNEIEKIEAVYSIGGLSEAIFMLGRLLENIILQYLIIIKKKKLISIKYSFIKSDNFGFENKIDFLFNKKFISPSQFSKMKSVKWDRNLYGHNNFVKPKDANAMIIIGLLAIEYIDLKIQRIKTNTVR